MNKTVWKTLLLTFCISIFTLGKSYALDQAAFLASSVYQNRDTGYTAYIDEEEENLRKQLIPLTEYGNVAFLSGRGEYSAESTIRNFYRAVFSGKSGLIFFIDMENREIRIESGGSFYKTITPAVANTITDNVYRFATAGEFDKTASLAFSQVEAKMEGRFLVAPMRWISNVFLALFLGLLFNFTFLIFSWQQKKASAHAVLTALHPNIKLEDKTVILTRQHKMRVSSGSSGRSGGGGFSGGGSSSGGGGHRF